MIPDSGRSVDRNLYQIARDEVRTTLAVPTYYQNHIDTTVDLNTSKYQLCPFHIEDTPSFVYKPEEDFWRCFGQCNTGGSAIDLHKHKFGFESHFDALLDLRDRFGDMYNLNFKNFFLDNNSELSIEDLAKPTRSGISMEMFMNPNEISISTLTIDLEKQLSRIKTVAPQSYAKCCAIVDNITVYKIEDLDEIKKILGYLKKIK